MTETVTEVHAWALLARLAEFWENPQPDRYTHRIPGRIAGSEHDQLVPEGTRNPYWEIIRQAPSDPDPWRKIPSPDGHFYPPGDRSAPYLVSRGDLCGLYSWSICSPGDVAWMIKRLDGRGIVEPGAGGGYWAWQLAQAGADVVAFDPLGAEGNKYVTGDPWFPVLTGDQSVAADHADRALFLCWPSYDEPWGAQALAAYKGDQLFYAGEGQGGCCADDEFFSLLASDWEEAGDCPAHVSFSGIHCYLTEYRRKGSRS